MSTNNKTTLTDLLQTGTSKAAALLSTQTPPAVGQYWPGQGGFYAGIMRNGEKQWHLILVKTPAIKAKWGTYGQIIPGEFSRLDGQHNTALILAAELDNKIASHFTALLIDGHKDCYWPSQCENNLLFASVPEHLTQEWHWSSTQDSALTAWDQGLAAGNPGISNKDIELQARAVRRVLI